MAITMQGSWTITVKAKNASFNQRFVIAGATSGNGTHAGTPGTSVFVTGSQWSINVQSQAPSQPWVDSRQRIAFPTVSASLLRFDIRSDDVGGGNDLDFDDLVLTCSMPVSASEFVVYGNAKTYQGMCRWNPCYPWYYVIDSQLTLQQALLVPQIRKVIEKLYPERVPKRPGPNPPPGPLFTPLVLPTGTPGENSGLVFRSASTQAIQPDTAIASDKDVRKFEEAAVARLRGTAQPVNFDGAPLAAGASLVAKQDLFALANVADKYKLYPVCTTAAAPGLLLRFLEYDRTSSEKLGGPYTGTGPRETLGLAATDELGNYVFRFSRSLSDIANETSDVGAGELLATQIFPDVIVQALGSSMGVDYESAPHYNIPNLIRIDLCLPYGVVHPSTGCGSYDRTIFKIGDIIVLHSALSGHPNTLDSIGRITCRNVNAPSVDCAAWRNLNTGGRVGLSMYACFGASNVASYTMRFRRIGIDVDWQFVDEGFKLVYVPSLGIPGYTGTSVGSTPLSVHVDGGAAVTRPTYANHQGDSNWIENDLKLILNTNLYVGPANHGSVDFKIQGYDAAGNHVAGTDDTIRLYLDNKPSTGSIKNVNAGTTADDDCALLTLPSASAPVTVQYTIDNPEGFLHSWALSVTRGNNYAMPVVIGPVVPQTYPAATLPDPCLFHGSQDYPLDAAGFTETVLQPGPHVDPIALDPSGLTRTTWLPVGRTFCAFAFTLTATDRVTDGRSAHPQTVFWQDLVGLSI
jgi:hypothetical protein